jgi:methyl-accepting chemotaxis protein
MASWSVSSVANNLDVLQAGLADDGVYTLKQSKASRAASFSSRPARWRRCRG